MAGQKVILVGVDGSAEANTAVDWAAARAKLDNSLVHVVCTYALASYSAAALDSGYPRLTMRRSSRALSEPLTAL